MAEIAEAELKKATADIEKIPLEEGVTGKAPSPETPTFTRVVKARPSIEVVDPRRLSTIMAPTPSLPEFLTLDFCYTKVSSKKTQWLRVTFPRAFASPPTVIVSVEYRQGFRGWLPIFPTSYDIDKPWFTDPTVSVDWFAGHCRDTIYAKVKGALGDWGILNWARDKIAGVIGGIGYWVGYLYAWLWNQLCPTIGAGIRNALQGTRNNLGGSNWLGTVNTDHAAYALNCSIDHLYQMSNMPQMKMSPAVHKPPTASYVDVLGYEESTVHVFAIGRGTQPIFMRMMATAEFQTMLRRMVAEMVKT